MNRFIPLKKRSRHVARTIEPGDRWFWPFYKPHQVSPWVAKWNRMGMNLRTKVEVVRGIPGTSVIRRDV
jgi:hypothetical protein